MARIAQTNAFDTPILRSLSGFPLKRKTLATLRRVKVFADGTQDKSKSFATRPVVLVNSLPKSGTHLLMQVAEALPETIQLGSFIAQRPSWANWHRSEAQILKRISNLRPGECVGAHLHFSADVAAALCNLNALHLFIYRDPRAVLVSEVQYLLQTARWNALHTRFARLDSLQEALALAIEGDDSDALPDISSRYQPYLDWKDDPRVVAVRYEDLCSPETRNAVLGAIGQKHAKLRRMPADPDLIKQLGHAIRPESSHTYTGQSPERWRRLLTKAQQEKLLALFPWAQ